MDIWKILGIDPTTDKKTIRRAYAAKTREIHPEEKPEEFRQLHEAYQAALGYADFFSKAEQMETEAAYANETTEESETAHREETTEEPETARTEETTGEPETARTEEAAGEPETAQTEETTGEAELISYFGEQQEKHRKRVEAFIKYWQEFQSPYHNPEVLVWWKNYLASEEFQEIRHHPQILHLLAEEIDDKFFYGINEVKLLFWDAYGFQEDEGGDLQGDLQRLWRSLYTAYTKRQKDRQNEKSLIKFNRKVRIFVGMAAAVILAVCIFNSVSSYRQRERGRLFLIDYMARQYPETTFSEPERLGKDGFGGDSVYAMCPSAHPELSVTATVKCRYEEGKKVYQVSENYGQLLFEYYAAQYGLEADAVYNMLFCPDIGQIDIFCETAEKMFREQKELHAASEASVCVKNVLFPEILFSGGVVNAPFSSSLTYDFLQMEASEVSDAIQEAYMIYMFQYEPWNITTEQYREWGAAYEKICEKWENEDGQWHEVCDPDTGECLCRLFVSTYERLDMYYAGDGTPVPTHTRMITVGNAYYFFQDRGADLSVDENGREFIVKFYGTKTWFGLEPEVKFDDLRKCY